MVKAVDKKQEECDPVMIVRAIETGDARAEACLFKYYQPRVLRVLAYQTGDAALAEDLTHDTLIAVLEKLRSGAMRDASRLSSYVFQTARFQRLCWLRKSANRVELGGSLDDVESQRAMPESEYFIEMERRELHRSIDGLTVERDREILMRHYVHEQSKSEICEALLLSSQHFDRVISRARLRLRQDLQREQFAYSV